MIGREDPEWQQAVTAVVVLESERRGDARTSCAATAPSRWPGFKVPKRVELASALPRTPSGKLMRRALR